MTVLPVIERELRAEARSAFTYWLRVLGGSALLATFVVIMFDQQDQPARLGARLFGDLNTALLAAIWIIGPVLTADCISRERRDGTLGLLFLTPLTPRAVVMGKGVIHGLRALSIFLASIPILAIPFLLGGVNWRDGMMALFLGAGSVCLALAAGLLASAWATQWNRALILAEILAAILLLTMMTGYAFLFSSRMGYLRGLGGYRLSSGEAFTIGFMILTDVHGCWNQIGNFVSAGATRDWLVLTAEIFILSVLTLGLAVLVAARRIRSSWQEEPASAWKLGLHRTFFEPRFWRSFFRGRMKRMLERNPVGWLEQRTAVARITKWGWCLFVVVVESYLVVAANWGDLGYSQKVVLGLLALSLAASAAGSFRRERQSGALELMLVTPLSERQIVLGRLFGIWGQFLPAVVILLMVLAGMDYGPLWPNGSNGWWSRHEITLTSSLLLGSTFLTAPLIGLHASLTQKSFLAAWLMTLGASVVLPWLLGGLTFLILEFWPIEVSFRITGMAPILGSVMFCVFQWLVASLAGVSLYRRLVRRQFALL